jgi:hypothetical protein
MKMKAIVLSAARLVMIAGLGIAVVSCGKSGGGVEGNTYEANGGTFQIQFKPDGKATVALGPMAGDCTYAQKDKTVSVTCEGDKIDFTVNDDGSISGPPDGMVGTLTKKAS